LARSWRAVHSAASAAASPRAASSRARSGRNDVSTSGHLSALGAATSPPSPQSSSAKLSATALGRFEAFFRRFGAAAAAAGGAGAGAAAAACAATYWALVCRPPPLSTVFSTVESNLSSMRPTPRAESSSSLRFLAS